MRVLAEIILCEEGLAKSVYVWLKEATVTLGPSHLMECSVAASNDRRGACLGGGDTSVL